MRWVYNALNLNADACEYLHLTPTGHPVRCVHRDLIMEEAQPITYEFFVQILEEVMNQSTCMSTFPLKLCTNSSLFHVIAGPFGFFILVFLLSTYLCCGLLLDVNVNKGV